MLHLQLVVLDGTRVVLDLRGDLDRDGAHLGDGRLDLVVLLLHALERLLLGGELHLAALVLLHDGEGVVLQLLELRLGRLDLALELGRGGALLGDAGLQLGLRLLGDLRLAPDLRLLLLHARQRLGQRLQLALLRAQFDAAGGEDLLLQRRDRRVRLVHRRLLGVDLLLQLLDLVGQLLLLRDLRGAQLGAGAGAARALDALLERLALRRGRLQVHPQLGERDLELLRLLLHGARLGLRAGARAAQLLELLGGLVRAREQLGQLLVAEHLALRLLRRHAPALRLAAALHGAAGVDDDAVGRDDAVALVAIEGDLARLLPVAAHERVLQREVEGDAVLLLGALDEVDEPLRSGGRLEGGGELLLQVLLPVERDERGDAELLLAHQLDALLRRAGVVHHDVVERAARRRDRDVELGRDAAQRAQPADDAGDRAVLLGLVQRAQLGAPRARVTLRILALGVLCAAGALLLHERVLLLLPRALLLLPSRELLLERAERGLGRAELVAAALDRLVVRLQVALGRRELVGALLLLLREQLRLAAGHLGVRAQRGERLRLGLALTLLRLHLDADRLRLHLDALVHLGHRGLGLLDGAGQALLLLLQPRQVLPHRAELCLHLALLLDVLLGAGVRLLELRLEMLELLPVLDVLALEGLELGAAARSKRSGEVRRAAGAGRGGAGRGGQLARAGGRVWGGRRVRNGRRASFRAARPSCRGRASTSCAPSPGWTASRCSPWPSRARRPGAPPALSASAPPRRRWPGSAGRTFGTSRHASR